MEFLDALWRHAFLQHALLAGLLASISCGIVGSYVVVRRISYIAGSISHCVLGGMGAARYLEIVHGWEGLKPLHGALFSALLAAVIIALVRVYLKEREDTVIGVVWATGMAIGLLFIHKTPGYSEDLMSYLFGSILFVSGSDLWLIATLDLIVLVVGGLMYRPLLAISFDEEFARLRGIRVEFYSLLLICLTALTVVVLVSIVGIVLVIALLTLPAATAGPFTKRLWQLMVASTLVSALNTTAGLWISYSPDLPTGAVIILVSGVLYILASILAALLPYRMERKTGAILNR